MAEDQLMHIEKMTNVELRAELKRRGCPTSGNKKDLITKLYAAIEKEKTEKEISSLNSSAESKNKEIDNTNITIPIDDQTTAQNQSHTPMIIISQQLPILPSVKDQQFSMNVDQVNDTSIVILTSEKSTRVCSNNTFIDSTLNENSNTTSDQQVNNNNEPNVLNVTANDNNVEIESFVSKSIEEEQKDIEKVGGETDTPSVGSNSAKSESILKEGPLSDEQQRLNQTNSEQQQTNQSSAIDEEPTAVTSVANNDLKIQNENADELSDNNLSTDLKTVTTEQQETKKGEKSPVINKPMQRFISQQSSELKTNDSQTSSIMKGFHRTTNNKINLSTEVLKTLISDLSLIPESALSDELDVLINEQTTDNINEQSINDSVLEKTTSNEFLPADSVTIGDLADQKHTTNRTVVMNANVNPSPLKNDILVMKRQSSISTHGLSSLESKNFTDGTSNTADEPIRIKNPTAVNEPLSQILYIRGLTRPFSLLQLKELLRRYGTLVDEKFWLDKIKSQCLVTYNNLEEAKNAREALDGCRWPSTNPKALSVRFAQQIELEFSKTKDLPPDQMSIDSVDRIIQDKSNIISSNESTSPANEIKMNTNKSNSDMRECDKRKLKETSQSGFLINEENEPIKSDAPPAKGLDDYFRKTKTKPFIYWLPLTEEQIIERNRKLGERNAKRDQELRKRELEGNNHSSNKSSRRSSSPKEKRKRSLSSNQYSKRH